VTPWGKPTKGRPRTRHNKSTDKLLSAAATRNNGDNTWRRSTWKGPFVDGYLLKKAEKSRGTGRNEIIKIWSRRSTILPQFVGLTFGVYNGHKFLPVLVTREHGRATSSASFSPTRQFHGHSTADKSAIEERMSKPHKGRPPRRERGAGRRETIRTSARKLNLVAQLIRGKDANKALAELMFSKRRIAVTVRKVLQAAIANAENNHQLDVDKLYVAEAHVGRSIHMRRFHARGRGRSAGIVKPFSHLTVIVRERASAATAEKSA